MCKPSLPIEHPDRISSFSRAVASLVWTPESCRASADVLFSELSKLTQAEIQYYYNKRVSSRELSGVCRLLAWLLGSIGVLVPLIKPILGEHAPYEFMSWGYIAFGLSGAALLFDSLFSGTQAHLRYTASQLELEKVYTVFSLEWQARILRLSTDPTPASTLDLIERAVIFANELHRVLGAETSSWQDDVSKSIEDLRTKIKNDKVI